MSSSEVQLASESKAKAVPVSQVSGVFLAIAAFTCFVLADTCIKGMVPFRMPAYQVVSSVALLEVLLLAGYALVRRRAGILWPKRPARSLLRSGLDLLNNVCVVIALRHLPLALFYILVFLAPAVTTLLEAFLLKEPLGRMRWLAVCTGFLGVVIAVDPLGSARTGDRIGLLACMVCVACFSANMVWSRRLTQDETTESLTFFSGLVQAATGVLLLFGHGVPVSWPMARLLMFAAVASLAGGLCFFLALRRTSAATVSQFHYTQLLTGALLAFLIWRERPTLFMVCGGVLIILSGWVAARLARQPRTVSLQP